MLKSIVLLEFCFHLRSLWNVGRVLIEVEKRESRKKRTALWLVGEISYIPPSKRGCVRNDLPQVYPKKRGAQENTKAHTHTEAQSKMPSDKKTIFLT